MESSAAGPLTTLSQHLERRVAGAKRHPILTRGGVGGGPSRGDERGTGQEHCEINARKG